MGAEIQALPTNSTKKDALLAQRAHMNAEQQLVDLHANKLSNPSAVSAEDIAKQTKLVESILLVHCRT